MPKEPKRSIRLVLAFSERLLRTTPAIPGPPLIKYSALSGSSNLYRISSMEGLTRVKVLVDEVVNDVAMCLKQLGLHD
jgi:hypothetical protein